MKEIANELAIAKASQDLDKLLMIYHPGCLIEYPAMGIKHRGTGSVRASMTLFKSMFRNFETCEVEYAYEQLTLVSWGRVRLTLAGNFNGHTPNGRSAICENMTVLKFCGNTVVYEANYLDLATLCFQSGIPVDAILCCKSKDPAQKNN